MNNGIGSASIVLVFAVLCLVIFTVISLITALENETLVNIEVNYVKAYYQADTVEWRVFNMPDWEADTRLNVWTG